MASGAVGFRMGSLQRKDIVMPKCRGRIEGDLIVTVQTGLLGRPYVYVYVTRQTILRQAQERRRSRMPGEIGQCESLCRFGIMAIRAGQLIVASHELIVTVGMIERVRIATGPGQDTDKWKRVAVVFPMA